MSEIIYSVGIDIGTSTTQMIFSKMEINNVVGFGYIPKVEIISKEVIARSDIYFTPLLSENEIDGQKVKEIILNEFKKSHIKPSDLSTGAVIITGETSRKRNAANVLDEMSEISGEFVVATAGPDLESVLAGKGSGAAKISKQTNQIVANLDIGGGTTNICFFEQGKVIDTACFDIGGRLIKLQEKRVCYIAKKLKALLLEHHISVEVGELLNEEKAMAVADVMTSILEQALGIRPATKALANMVTNHGIRTAKKAEIITFSGGVADCIYNHDYEDMYYYGDIGIFFGRSLADSLFYKELFVARPLETMRATVIGAGNYSMEVSGSTIEYANIDFPLKNIPVVRVQLENEQDIEPLSEEINVAVKSYLECNPIGQIAISMKGLGCPTFLQIEKIAEQIGKGIQVLAGYQVILILEEDIGKALGQAVKRIIAKDRPMLCIDSVSCTDGDYIDIGVPVSNGKAVPVVVKTLIFSDE